MGPELRFERLYGEHERAVRGYALRRCDAATADDVVADVFLVAWRRLDDVPEDALPWLLGTARRVLANHARGTKRRLALRQRLGAEMASAPPSWSGSADGALLQALASLQPMDREALLLVAWEGLEPRRAAEALGVRPKTFAVRLHRARRRLAAALSAEEQGRETDPGARTEMEVPS